MSNKFNLFVISILHNFKLFDIKTFLFQFIIIVIFVYTQQSKLEAQSTLTIVRVTQRDYGKYNCRAQNTVGHTSDVVHLDVTSPPDQPSDLEVYNVTHDSVTLIWKKGFDGGLPTSYRIRWRQALDYLENYYYLDVAPGSYTATISGLNLATYYVFSIMARNVKGESTFLPDLVKVQTLRKYIKIFFSSKL